VLLTAGVTSAQETKQTEYHVYPLKHADANEVAKSLEMLLNLDDAQNKTRIIPEPRINALFVSGPKETLREIEQFLKILDQQSLGEIHEIKVFALRNLRAQDAQATVSALVNNAQISVDQRTNSLIAVGKEDDLKAIEAILMKLDEATQPANREQVTAINLEHISPQKAYEILINLGSRANIAVDEPHKRLLVSSDAQTLAGLLNTIKQVDLPEQKTLDHAVLVRLIWLMEDKEQAKAAEPGSSDSDIERVARTVEKRLGLSHLKTVAQILVPVEPGAGRPFTARGTADLTEETIANLEFEGVLAGGSAERPVMEFTVNATQRLNPATNFALPPEVFRAERELASLSSKVTIPAGHSIVLGMTSIRSTASVFILQILPADAELQEPR